MEYIKQMTKKIKNNFLKRIIIIIYSKYETIDELR